MKNLEKYNLRKSMKQTLKTVMYDKGYSLLQAKLFISDELSNAVDEYRMEYYGCFNAVDGEYHREIINGVCNICSSTVE